MSRDGLYRVGLTGGIASGKSTVANMLRELGAVIIDTDAIAREVTVPGSLALRELSDRYGPEILNEDGSLRRDAVGRIVFTDPTERKWLEKLLHPLIRERAEQLAAAAAATGHRFVFFDVPLLYETGWNAWVDEVWTVYVPVEAQRQRLQRRDGHSEPEIAARIASQWPIDEKAGRADVVIDNSGSPSQTRQQVETAWKRLAERLANRTQEESF